MTVAKIDTSRLKNNAHFQLMTEVTNQMKGYPEVLLKIKPQYDVFLEVYAKEDAALKRVRKSVITEDIDLARRERNTAFRGLSDMNRALLNHFTPEFAAAARRMQVVFDKYGNVSKLSTDEETTAINNLLAELSGNYADDLATTDLSDWAKELKRRNDLLAELVKLRYLESAERPDFVMKNLRAELDEAFRVLMLCIEALYVMAVTDEERLPFEQCIRLMNVVIGHYNNLIARMRSHGNPTPASASEAVPDPNTTPEDGEGTDTE